MPDKTPRVSMKGQLGRGADAFFGGEDGGQDTSNPEKPQSSMPVIQQEEELVFREIVMPVKQQDGRETSQERGITLNNFAERFVEQYTGKEVEKYTKGTYYITPEQELKLERVRLLLRTQGLRVDKSAIMRSLIDLLPEE